MNDTRVIRDYVVKASRALESANNRIVSAFQYSNHAPFPPSFDAAIRFVPRYARNHTVAMHGCSNVLRRNENVRSARGFWRQKTVACLMNRHFAGNQVSLGWQNIPVLPDAGDLTRALELAQTFA